MNRRRMLKYTGGALLGTSLLSQNVAAQFEGGDGTESDPYQIANRTQLEAIDDDINAHYILVDDIDLSGGEWTPLATGWFTGSLDGDGHVIDGMTITSSTGDALGLFALGETPSFYNLTLSNVEINIPDSDPVNQATGAVIGYADNYGDSMIEFKDVHVDGVISVNGGGGYTGGLCARLLDDLTTDGTQKIHISDCTVDMDVEDTYSGDHSTGLLMGRVSGHKNNVITRCEITGTLNCPNSSASSWVAGGIAEIQGGGMSETAIDVEVLDAGDAIVGGVGGVIWSGGSDHLFTDIYARGSLVGGTVGGAFGDLQTDDYSGDNPEYLTLENIFTVASVSGSSTEEGFVATTSGAVDSGNLSGLYYDMDRTGIASDSLSSTEGVNQSDLEGSAAQDTLTEYDFENIWRTASEHPKFQWNAIPTFGGLFYNPDTLITNHHTGEPNTLEGTSRETTEDDQDISDMVRVTIKEQGS